MNTQDEWIICETCRGEGTTVNPNIDANGLTACDFEEDPGFLEDYMEGIYDVSCGACGGSGKMRRSRIEELRQGVEDRQLAALEDGDYEAYQFAHDFRFGG